MSVILGSGTKGVDDLCIHSHMGNFLLLHPYVRPPPPGLTLAIGGLSQAQEARFRPRVA